MSRRGIFSSKDNGQAGIQLKPSAVQTQAPIQTVCHDGPCRHKLNNFSTRVQRSDKPTPLLKSPSQFQHHLYRCWMKKVLFLFLDCWELHSSDITYFNLHFSQQKPSTLESTTLQQRSWAIVFILQAKEIILDDVSSLLSLKPKSA